MAPGIGWNPLGQKGPYSAKGARREFGPRVDLVRMVLVIIALLAIVSAIYLLDTYPEILEKAKSTAAAVWDMLGNLADACRRFADYLRAMV